MQPSLVVWRLRPCYRGVNIPLSSFSISVLYQIAEVLVLALVKVVVVVVELDDDVVVN